MEEIRLTLIEWNVMTVHHRRDLGVRLEESGDEGVIVLDSVHDDFLHCNGECWPEIGERVRIRPDGSLRLSGRPSCVDRMLRRHRWPGKRIPLESYKYPSSRVRRNSMNNGGADGADDGSRLLQISDSTTAQPNGRMEEHRREHDTLCQLG